ncbi:MAG: polyprenol monophosphomannose synthase [Endomicrobium sp.]|jgi:dolichol-phosphate mannosyltransferase|nr:polyprenol monophosphomannose synthase [Endomicrobium sp.]
MKTIVVILTYNEVSNIEKVICDVLKSVPNAEVLVVDDMSPDGTYKVVEDIAKQNSKVHLLLRKEKKGRGYAGKDGFIKALEMNADFIVEMDGDGSHDPKYIPEFLEVIRDCDVVIGARYIGCGKDEERTLLRKLISKFSRLYISTILGVDNIKDPGSGYRIYKKDALTKFVYKLKASDPFIVTEIIYQLKKNNLKVKESPIIFLERFSGESKLRAITLIKYLFKVLKLKMLGQ